MKWRFWSKDKGNVAQKDESKYIPFQMGKTRTILSKPRDLPSMVGRHLVVALRKDPNWVRKLKAVLHPKEDQKNSFRIRIFDPETAKAKGVTVDNFTCLNTYPQLILFEGWIGRNGEDIVLKAIGHHQVTRNK